MRLKGKVALLTGAAAALDGELMGFGGAVAHRFLREGAKIILTDIRDELGEKSAVALRGQGYEVIYISLDVTSEVAWNQAIDKGLSAFGRLDVLFNNTGVALPA